MSRGIALLRATKRVSNYDFFPHFSRKTRGLLTGPLGVLIVATLIAIFCGFVLHPRLYTLAGGLVAVIALGVCWPWLTARAIRAALSFDRNRASELEAVWVAVSVANYLPWSAWGLRAWSCPRSDADDSGLAVRIPSVDGRTRTSSRWEFVPRCRGEYPQAPLAIGTGFPFGLWETGQTATIAKPLIVWPRTFPVGPVPLTDGDDVADGNVTRNRVGSTGDVLGVRPYRRGDSPRRIHWPQSARHDRLIVCELQSPSRPVVLLLLDCDPSVHTTGRDGSREWAIRVCASLAKGWLEAGAQVGAVWDGAFFPPASGPAQITKILDALARISGSCQVPLAEVLCSASASVAGANIRVAVTTDAALAHLPEGAFRRDIRWVVLERDGFDGTETGQAKCIRSETCDEAPIRPGPRPWVTFRDVADVPHLLRYGWSEARHGS